MNLVAKEVVEYLQDNGIGTEGTDLFYDAFPDDRNNIIGIFTTGGETPDIYLPTANPSFEVLVRDTTQANAYSKISNIVALLHEKYNLQLVDDGNYYFYILLMGEINTLGRDDKQRIEYSANFRTYIRER
jgi:hypothetical protein